MRPASKLVLRACLIALTVALLTPTASAKSSVVVLDFDGRNARSVRRDVTKIMRRRHTMVASRSYRMAARALGARKMRSRNVARVATRIGADIVISGRVVRRQGRQILRLRVRSGANGKVLEKYTVALQQGRRLGLSPKVARRLSGKLSGTIRRAMQRTKRRPRNTRQARQPTRRHRRPKSQERRETRTSSRRQRIAKQRTARVQRQRAQRRQQKLRAGQRRVKRQQRQQAKRDRKQRAERKQRQQAKRERKRRVKKKQRAKPRPYIEKTDADGNVIDDEIPDVLRRKR